MTSLRSLLGVAMLLLGSWIVALNWIIFWRGWIRRQQTASLIPLIGAVISSVALLLLPVPWLHWMAWIPFIIDWGSVPAIVVAIVKHVRRSPHDQ
jgi:hypothetical protein